MAGQDRFMNDFAPVTDASYIYAEAADGSQVKIKRSDLFSVLFQDRGAISNGEDLNKYRQGMFYIFPENGTVLNGPPFGRFILLCFTSGGHVVQFAVNVHPGQYNFMYRTSHNNGGLWNLWKSISMT